MAEKQKHVRTEDNVTARVRYRAVEQRTQLETLMNVKSHCLD